MLQYQHQDHYFICAYRCIHIHTQIRIELNMFIDVTVDSQIKATPTVALAGEN